MSAGVPRSARDDGQRRANRRPRREDAAEINVLLPETAHRIGVQLVEERLIVGQASRRAIAMARREAYPTTIKILRAAPSPASGQTVRKPRRVVVSPFRTFRHSD